MKKKDLYIKRKIFTTDDYSRLETTRGDYWRQEVSTDNHWMICAALFEQKLISLEDNSWDTSSITDYNNYKSTTWAMIKTIDWTNLVKFDSLIFFNVYQLLKQWPALVRDLLVEFVATFVQNIILCSKHNFDKSNTCFWCSGCKPMIMSSSPLKGTSPPTFKPKWEFCATFVQRIISILCNICSKYNRTSPRTF